MADNITCVPTWAGFIYLAVVVEVWSWRVVGWSIGERMTAELVLAALNMALQQRRPAGVVHHCDQGSPVHEPGRRQLLHGDGRAPVGVQRGRCLRQRDGRGPRVEHWLTNVGDRVARATPPVDNPAPALIAHQIPAPD